MKVAPVLEIPTPKIVASPLNPRKHFDEDALKELAESIKAHGIIQPLTVRPIKKGAGRPAKDAPEYEIVCGERRFRAGLLAELATIPCLEKDLTDDEVLEIAVIENNQREDISPLEEAAGFQAILAREIYDIEQLAGKIGRAPDYVHRRVKLLNLSEEGRASLEAGQIPIGIAELIARLSTEDQATGLAHATSFNKPSIAQFRSWVENHVTRAMANARFDINDAALVEAAGPCSTCFKRTSVNKSLFGDMVSDDRCTDRACWQSKIDAHTEQLKSRPGMVVLGQHGEKSEGAIAYGQWQQVYNLEIRPEYTFPEDLPEELSSAHRVGWSEYSPKREQEFNREGWEDDHIPEEIEAAERGFREAKEAYSKLEPLAEGELPPGVQLGLIADGYDKGSLVPFKLREGGSNDDGRNAHKEAERKTKIERHWRGECLRAVIAHRPSPAVNENLLRAIITSWWTDIDQNMQQKLGTILGWVPSEVENWQKKIERKFDRAAAEANTKEATEEKLVEALLALIVGTHVDANTYGSSEPVRLLALAEQTGIDVDHLKREAEEKFAPKPPKKPKAAAEVATEEVPA